MSYEDQLGSITARVKTVKDAIEDAQQIIEAILFDIASVRRTQEEMSTCIARAEADLTTLRAQLVRPE